MPVQAGPDCVQGRVMGGKPFHDLSRLERDIARIGIVVAAGLTLTGAALGWCARFFTERHSTVSRSDHFR